MKKIKRIIFVSLALLLLGACMDRYEKDIFSKGPSERMQESVSEYHQLLQSSSNGWVLQYYPDGSQRKMGGYNYILKFTKEEVTAILVGQNRQVTSKYAIIPNGGPTLSFDEYNEALHFFAKPSEDKYQGYIGDYEFLFLSHEEGIITLKGKKYGNIARLVKLSESSNDYLNKLETISNGVSSGIVKLLVNNEEEKIDVVDIRNIVFSFENQGEKNKQIAYVITDKGIRFYEPVVLAGNSYQDFEYNMTDKTLVSPDGKAKFLLAYPLPFDFKRTLWKMKVKKSGACSQKLIQQWENVNQLHKANARAEISETVEFGYLKTSSYEGISIVFLVGYNGSQPQYYAVRRASYMGTLTKDEIHIQVGAPGVNWNYFSHLQPFMGFIQENSPYKFELDDQNNPTKIKLISTKDSDIWFTFMK